METVQDIYPESGPYRKYRNLVEERAVEIEKQLESPEKFKFLLSKMFVLSPEDLESLSTNEVVDLKNFIRHATKRLAAGEVSSPIHQDLLAHNANLERTSEVKIDFLAHDLMHTFISYVQSDGKTLRPFYTVPDTKEEVYLGVTSNQEELMVFLWNDSSSQNYFDYLVSGGDPLEYVKSCGIGLNKEGNDSNGYVKRFEEAITLLAPLKESDPFEYVLHAYEAKFLLVQQSFFEKESYVRPFNDTLIESIKKISKNRDPKYIAMAKALYDNRKAEKPDQKIRLHEFQRVVKPLTEQLRAKSELVSVE